MNTLEGNKLIAEFMGWNLGHPDKSETRWQNEWFDRQGFKTTTKGYLHFDTSWDWLMPVVEEILRMNSGILNIKMMSNACRIYADDNSFNHLEEQNSTIEATYKAVLQFIQWYNENK